MSRVFLDTSYILALELKRDRHHALVQQHWQQVQAALLKLVTTSYVFDEVVTFFHSRGQHAKAVEVGNNVLRSSIGPVRSRGRGTLSRGMGLFSAVSG